MYNPILQFFLTPLYNLLRYFKGDAYSAKDEDDAFPWDKVKLVDTDAIMKYALGIEQFGTFHTILTYQTAKAFMSRDMDNALEFTNLYFEHFAVSVTVHLTYSIRLIGLSSAPFLEMLQ